MGSVRKSFWETSFYVYVNTHTFFFKCTKPKRSLNLGFIRTEIVEFFLGTGEFMTSRLWTLPALS
jgi:hypothetical protein